VELNHIRDDGLFRVDSCIKRVMDEGRWKRDDGFRPKMLEILKKNI
jgi:hypothetical protein